MVNYFNYLIFTVLIFSHNFSYSIEQNNSCPGNILNGLAGSFPNPMLTYRNRFDNIMVPRDWKENHTKTMSLLNQYKPFSPSTKRKSELSSEETNILYRRISENPDINTCNVTKGSTEDKLGFCFGRSSATYIEALSMGSSKNSVLKIWVDRGSSATAFKDHNINWEYHVATTVNTQNGWMVIDHILFDSPVTVRAWYNRMTELASNSPFNLHITTPDRTSRNSQVPKYEIKLTSEQKEQLSSKELDQIKVFNNYWKQYLENFRLRQSEK